MPGSPALPAPASFENSRWPPWILIAGSGAGYSLVAISIGVCAMPAPALALRWAAPGRYVIRVSRTHLLHVHLLTGATTAHRVAALRGPRSLAPSRRPLSSQHVDPFRTQADAVRLPRSQVTTPRLDRPCTATRCRSPGTRSARGSRPAPTATSSRCLRRRLRKRPRRRAAGRRARSTASTTGASASCCAAAACDSPSQPGQPDAAPVPAARQSNIVNRGQAKRECERA